MNILRMIVISLFIGAMANAEDSPRQRQNIDFDWQFHLGDAPGASEPGFVDGSWRLLDLPHDFSAEGEFARTNASGTAYLPGGMAWYRKAVIIPGDWQTKLVSVEFDGVSMNSEVWVNGHLLGKRPYAFSTFSYDLTPYLVPGKNVLAVRVDHSVVADSRFYIGSGIYRHVWLNATEKLHVARHGQFVTTPTLSAERAQAAIQTRVQNETASVAEVELVSEVVGPGQQVVQQVTNKETIPAGGERDFLQNADVGSPKLWSPATPTLYRVVTTIRTGGKRVDHLETLFGIRSIRFDAQNGFFLNGQPMKFKGICMHHDAGVVGAAVPDAVLERRLRLAKEYGCNAIRTSHNPMAPEFYDLCDRIGLMVMDEAFDEWTDAKNKWVQGRNVGTPSLHGYADYFGEWAEADLREMVTRDRNHPSVVLWSIGNEIDYPNDPFSYPTDGNQYDPQKPSAEILAQTAPRLIRVVHESDSSRPVTAALANLKASNPTGLAGLLDVVGYNYQVEEYARDFAAFPARKIVGSENGFGMEYVEITKQPRVTGQFLWVGFDFLGECGSWPSRGSESGMFDTCGFLKPQGMLRAALWSEKPVIFINVRRVRGGGRGGFGGGNAGNHWNWQNDARTELPVDVYANCETVELFLNGQSLGSKSAVQSTNCVFTWNVAFKAGELKAVGTRGGQTVDNRLKTAGALARFELVADRAQLAADGRDVAHVELRLVDAQGLLVSGTNVLCTATVTGAGHLLGLDNGNQRDMTALHAPSRITRQGRALALVQTARKAGPITLTVSAPGLPDAQISLQSE
jgi:beta-galactosidase